MKTLATCLMALTCLALPVAAQEADDPELIFKNTTVWRMLSPDAKLSTYVIDDPGLKVWPAISPCLKLAAGAGWAGFAEETFRNVDFLPSGGTHQHQGQI